MLLFALLTLTSRHLVWGAVPVEQDAADRNYQDQLPHIDPTEPADVKSTFRIEAGFHLELVASEPLINDPVAAAFDEFGRMYVVEMRDYSEDDKLNLGRVKRLEDTDHDGRFDHATLFADGLSWPTAIACWKGGVIVAQPPWIVYHSDTDQDGKSDHHESLFHGFGRDNVQGMINSFRWGPDNRLYGSSSTNGGDIESLKTPNQPPIRLRRRDFRIDPRTWQMEPVTGGGQHGMSFDRWGSRYVCSNSDHLQWIAYEQDEISRHPRLGRYPSVKSIAADGPAAEVFRISPVEPWRLVRTRLRLKGLVPGPVEGGGRAAGYFTSATGITIYQGDAYPEPFRSGTFAFVGDVGGNLIHCKEIRQEELEPRGYRLQPDHEFLASTDVWFRPVQMELGPDGNLYVLDMYREVIEHPASLPSVIKQHLDLTRGRDRGRIYRIVSSSHPIPVERTLPGGATATQLCQMVAHTNAWHRDTAARLILQDPQPVYTGELQQVLRTSTNPLGRARALQLLVDLKVATDHDFVTALKDTDPHVRCQGIALAHVMQDQSQLLELFSKLADDPDPNVLRRLVLALDSIPEPQRLSLWTQLVQKAPAMERLTVALLDGVEISPYDALQQLIEAKLSSNASPQWERIVTSLLQQLGTSLKSAEITDMLALLDQLDEVPSRDRRLDLLSATRLPRQELIELLREGNMANAEAYIDMCIGRAKRVALDGNQPSLVREQAVEFLGLSAGESNPDFWRELLSADTPTQVRLVTLRAIPQACPESGATLLLHALPQLIPQERQVAWDLLLARKEWIHEVLAKLASGELLANEISVAHRDRLLRNDDSAIRTAATKWFAPPADRQQTYKRYAQVLQMEGDIERGEQVFRRACATCHRIGNLGSNVGPELTAARRKGAEFLLTNVVDPNREVDARYEGYSVETKDGRILTGLVVEQSGTSVTLRRPEGIEERLAISEIEAIRSTGRSLMPEGLETDITLAQMADLLAYLAHDVSIEK